jgi:4-amino-4-deoxy-L-arabinose transferase-like glycosyltransferase
LTGLTVVVTFLTARRLYDERTALLAAAILTVSPMFQFFGTAAFPEVFEIFAVTVAVYTFVRYRDGAGYPWLGASVLFLIAGILDHAWAALVFAPLAVVTFVDREYAVTALYGVSTALSAIFVYYVTNISGKGSSLEAYSVFYQPGPLFDPMFYVDFSYNALGFALSPVLGVLVVPLAAYYFLQQRQLLVATWTIAGLSPVILFPRGASIHFYYLWGLLVPGSMLLAIVVSDAAEWVSRSRDQVTSELAVSIGTVVVLGLVLISSLIVGPLGLIMPPPAGADRLTEGTCVRDQIDSRGIEIEDVAIVTSLEATKEESGATIYLHAYLMYARLYMRAPDSPHVYRNVTAARADGHPIVVDFNGTYVEAQSERGPSPSVYVRKNRSYTRICRT